jgi:putative FmdB family regulatory protein
LRVAGGAAKLIGKRPDRRQVRRRLTMPLYEYECRGCGHRFEALVRGSIVPACPSCQGQDLQQLLSLFAVSSDGTRRSNLQAAKKKNSKVLRDKQMAQLEYEKEHQH